MTTELQQYQGSSMEQAPMQRTETMSDLERQSMEMEWAYRIAESMCNTALVPKAYFQKPYDGAAAIMFGRELGMNAIQSLQNVVVINGKPGIESRTMVALLKRRGYKFKTEESVTDRGATVTVIGMSPNGEQESSTWDMERAKQAGYVRNALYSKTPTVMLYAKAAGEVCRRLAPDVLMGIGYNTEELQLGFGDAQPEPIKASATIATPQAKQIEQAPQTKQQQQLVSAVFGNAQPQPEPEPVPNVSEDARLVEQEIRSCNSLEEMNTISEWAQSVAGASSVDGDYIRDAWAKKTESFN